MSRVSVGTGVKGGSSVVSTVTSSCGENRLIGLRYLRWERRVGGGFRPPQGIIYLIK